MKLKIPIMLAFFVCVLYVLILVFSMNNIHFVRRHLQFNSNVFGIQQPIDAGQVTADAGPGKVLITTYMRSGSTFVGKILGWRNDTFYLFEPLWKHNGWKYFHDNDIVCSSSQLTCERIPFTSQLSLNRALQFIEDIYRCNMSNYHDKIDTKFHAAVDLSGPSWNVHRECMKKKNDKIACLEEEYFVCKNASNIVIKVLRLSLELAKSLLITIPDLKIIHLLRDPRAVMNSRVDLTPWYKSDLKSPARVENDIQVQCSRMQSDIDVGKQLMKDFPDRVKLVQYEDFRDPVDRAEKLYRFLGMRYTESDDSVRQFVNEINNQNKTSVQHTDGFHPFEYRKTFPWKYVKLANKYCSTVFKELGLVQFNNEADYKNESINVIQTSLPFGLG